MQVFITGTDTNIGKTLVSSWLCLHTRYSYFKPIQTGGEEARDSIIVKELSGAKIHPETYIYSLAASPHIASAFEGDVIEAQKIILPSDNLIIEGAGGLMVPINHRMLMIDLIKQLNIPVILVTNPRLGAINHSLLSLEALRLRNIKVLGMIFSGEAVEGSYDIGIYGNTEILGSLPNMNIINRKSLENIPLSTRLQQILGIENESK